MPTFNCPHCDQSIAADDSMAGSQADCPTCQQPFIVPGEPPPVVPPPAFGPPLPPVVGSVPPPSVPPPPRGGFTPTPGYMGRAASGDSSPHFQPPKKKGFAGIIAAIVIGLVFVAAVGLGAVFIIQQKLAHDKSEKETTESMKDSLKWALEASKDPTKPVDLSTAPLSKKPATNDAERMRDFAQSFIVEMAGLQNTYLKNLDDAGISKLLDPNRIAADKDFHETHELLDKITEVVDSTHKKVVKTIEDMPRRAGELQIDERERKGFLEGFNKGFSRTLPLFRENWNIESEAAVHFAELVKVLETSRGHWQVKDNQFLFQRDADIQRFNQIMDQISKGTARQEQIRQILTTNATHSVQRIEDATN